MNKIEPYRKVNRGLIGLIGTILILIISAFGSIRSKNKTVEIGGNYRCDEVTLVDKIIEGDIKKVFDRDSFTKIAYFRTYIKPIKTLQFVAYPTIFGKRCVYINNNGEIDTVDRDLQGNFSEDGLMMLKPKGVGHYGLTTSWFNKSFVTLLASNETLADWEMIMKKSERQRAWKIFLDGYFGQQGGGLFINLYPTDAELPIARLPVFAKSSEYLYRSTAQSYVQVDCQNCLAYVWINIELNYNRAGLMGLNHEDRIVELLANEMVGILSTKGATDDHGFKMTTKGEAFSTLVGLQATYDKRLASIILGVDDYWSIVADIGKLAEKSLLGKGR